MHYAARIYRATFEKSINEDHTNADDVMIIYDFDIMMIYACDVTMIRNAISDQMQFLNILLRFKRISWLLNVD